MRRLGKLLKCLLKVVSLVAITSSVNAQELPEQTLRAAYLYHLAALTEWPQSNKTAFQYCFYQAVDYQPAIDLLKNKKIENKPIEINYLSTPEQAKACDVLVIGTRERYLVKNMLSAVANHPVLTVAEAEVNGFEQPVINLITSGKKIHFEVNLIAAKAAGIVLSSRLLRVAQKVIQ